MAVDREAEFRARLLGRLEELTAGDDLGRSAQRVVRLDQQSVGRLSRKDALQSQAMAQATGRMRAQEAQRCRAALERLDEGEFGYCLDCGETIARERLDHDPATPLCIACARG